MIKCVFKLSEEKIPVFFGVIHPILGVFSSFFHFRREKPVSSGAVFPAFFSTMRKKPANPVSSTWRSIVGHQ